MTIIELALRIFVAIAVFVSGYLFFLLLVAQMRGKKKNNSYEGKEIVVIHGQGKGQRNTIKHYDGETGVLTVDEEWEDAPDLTSVIIIEEKRQS